MAEKRVKPILLDYSVGTLQPSYDIIEILPLAILQLSWTGMKCVITEMPDFEPTEYLFETHKDKGQDRWEIYAWALRDAMRKCGNLEECNMPMKEKIVYEGYMQMQTKYANSPFLRDNIQSSPRSGAEGGINTEKNEEKIDPEIVKIKQTFDDKV